MKKIACIMLMFCFAFIFTACGETDEFWKQTLTQYELILGTDASPKNSDIFYSDNLVYISNVQDAINLEDSEFASLKNYEEMLKLSFDITKRYYKNFGIVTLKVTDGSVRDAHNSLREEIVELDEEISAFRTAKSEFENAVKDVQDIPNSANALQELKEYKRAFSSLILKVSQTNISFLDTYELSYNQISTAENSDMKYCYTSSMARIIYSYNLYAFGEFDGEYQEVSEIKAYIDDLNSKLTDQTNFISTSFAKWNDVYERFMAEIELYQTALDEIDYLNVDTQDKLELAHKTKIDSFLNSYVEVLYNSTLKLIGAEE